MIYEFAALAIDLETAADFEDAVRDARPIFLAAEGRRDMHLDRVIELVGQDLLVAQWGTVEVHMEDFRRSNAFQTWRDVAAPYFTEMPQVVHVGRVL